jgi:hypothetical protein
MKRKRLIYRLRWVRNRWGLYEDGFGLVRYRGGETKALAEIAARDYCRAGWKRDNEPCQLLIYRKDGKIARGGRSEASYGCNSRSRG